jgi:MOSC domain-containing protein YiiM
MSEHIAEPSPSSSALQIHEPELPYSQSEISAIWRRSAQAEGNPFHKCFSRVPVSFDTSSTSTKSNLSVIADTAIPIETCPEDDLFRLPSGAVAVPLLHDGLAGSSDWHRDKQVAARLTLTNPTDRSILIQTKEHLSELVATFPELKSSLEAPCSFGQNLLISGDLTAKTVCIGDVLHVVRPGINGTPDQIVGILQVSNPRLPCFKVDYKHKTSQPGEPSAAVTVRGKCAASGLGGFFCRVLQPGSIAPTDRLVVAQRPHTQWTLARISELMYGGINAKQAELRVWRGTEEQLHELMELKVENLFFLFFVLFY